MAQGPPSNVVIVEPAIVPDHRIEVIPGVEVGRAKGLVDPSVEEFHDPVGLGTTRRR